MERSEVHRVIDSERDYQDQKWGPEGHPASQFLIDIEKHLNDAKNHQYAFASKDVADEIRKIGALCVKFGEVHGIKKR